MPVALTGSDSLKIAILYKILRAQGVDTWIVWDATIHSPPEDLSALAGDKLLTFRACAYAAECQILAHRRILDRANTDSVWTLDTDMVCAKDVPAFLEATENTSSDDIILGMGFSRFSRKSVEHISRDFGSGLDYSGLTVSTI